MNKTIKRILKPLIYSILSLYYRIKEKFSSLSSSNDEYGKCSVCGRYSKFWYNKIIDENSLITVTCGFDKEFTEVINITNSLHCRFCSSKFRVRCAAASLLKNLPGNNYKSIKQLVKGLGSSKLKIFETASTDGIFSNYTDTENIIKTEYFDDTPRGEYKNSIRSEDLQKLTFENESINIAVALDVFEHLSEPETAFSEIHRILKPNGIAVITVPIDERIEKSTRFAEVINGEIKYFREPAYHSDRLREKGALVFTEFGMDIEKNIKALGYNAVLEKYTTQKSKVNQYVIVIKKI
jgi:predicted SAM-dependent methyltransferase